MIHERFKQYFHETFFVWKDEEFHAFISSLEQGIPRTIRVQPDIIDPVKKRLESDGWILDPTPITNVFALGRREDFDPLERRIGYSADHLVGNFYIQELAAAHPVDILADGHVQEDAFLILDMASSPGGKTTQLAEYFPNSFIVANEPTRERIPQLLQNLDRMWSANIGVTLYPGQYWKGFPETFDRILLDAPCSGEWTLYKWTDATKHWHIKNIKNIAKLQEKLLESSLHCLKVGWEMIYSTCSLNLLENEWVLSAIEKKYGDSIQIVFQKKFWPHIDGTGGFFVSKIQKIAPIAQRENPEKVYHSNDKLKKSHQKLGEWELIPWIDLYEHDGKFLAVKNSHLAESLRQKTYFMRWGDHLGQRDAHGKIAPWVWSHRYINIENLATYCITTQDELDLYLRGHDIVHDGEDEWKKVVWNDIALWLEYSQTWIIHNRFPLDWRRR